MSVDKIIVNSSDSKNKAIKLIEEMYSDNGYITLSISKGKPRTNQQRKSIEVYCSEMAGFLNDRGIDYVQWVKHKNDRGIQAPWTQELFKGVFRDYAAALFPEIVNKKGVASTSKLSSHMITDVYELVNMRMSTIFGCGTLWPSEENKKDGA